MKNLLKFPLVVFITFFAATTVFAQDWSKEQLEIWKAVEGGWVDLKNSDIESLSAKYHEKFQEWNNNSPLPISKEMFFDSLKGFFAKGGKVNYFTINPARIAVTDNAAVVDYYGEYKMTVPNEGGETKTTTVSGKYVFFLVKEKGKWFLLGDMSVVNSAED